MLQQENLRPHQQVVTIKDQVDVHEVDRQDLSELSSECAIGPASSELPDFPTAVDYTRVVVDEDLQLWLRRCRRKFMVGATVIKVANTGKLVKRQLYIGAKPEYMELISTKLFDTAYHLSSITSVERSLDSPDFEAFRAMQPDCMPKLEKSLVIGVNAKTISLVFECASDRRDAQLYITAQTRMIARNGAVGLREYERRTTIPLIKAQRRACVTESVVS